MMVWTSYNIVHYYIEAGKLSVSTVHDERVFNYNIVFKHNLLLL